MNETVCFLANHPWFIHGLFRHVSTFCHDCLERHLENYPYLSLSYPVVGSFARGGNFSSVHQTLRLAQTCYYPRMDEYHGYGTVIRDAIADAWSEGLDQTDQTGHAVVAITAIDPDIGEPAALDLVKLWRGKNKT